jgi:hypothetical protein
MDVDDVRSQLTELDRKTRHREEPNREGGGLPGIRPPRAVLREIDESGVLARCPQASCQRGPDSGDVVHLDDAQRTSSW